MGADMKKVFICFTVLLSAITVLCAADSYPEFAEIKKALRKQHPRLFITGDQLICRNDNFFQGRAHIKGFLANFFCAFQRNPL